MVGVVGWVGAMVGMAGLMVGVAHGEDQRAWACTHISLNAYQPRLLACTVFVYVKACVQIGQEWARV